jgi:hypothetical protein
MTLSKPTILVTGATGGTGVPRNGAQAIGGAR